MLKNKKFKNIYLLIISIFIIIFVFAFNINLTTKYYKIDSHKLNENVRILFISDLHSSYYGKNQKNLLTSINLQNPDIILLGGDIADDKRTHENTEILLKNISKKYPCYYVSGNHEFWSGEINNIKKMFLSYGITILEGNNKIISVNNQKINICGVDDPEIGKNTFFKQINNISNLINNSFFTIFLSHRPEYINTYIDYDFDLILSGHAYGGQWIIPGILNGFYAPNQDFFPEYAGGLYKFDKKIFIVNRGLAKWSASIIPRIFNPPELVIIDIF